MNRREYDRLTGEQLRGRKVRTLCPMSNGFVEIPAGTILTIGRKFSGFTMRSEPCSLCGVRVLISRVEPQSVELLPKEGP